MEIYAINDEFVTHQTVEQAFLELGFDTQSIVKDILKEIWKNDLMYWFMKKAFASQEKKQRR